MAQLEVTCPPCGTALTADTEEELIPIVQDHARKEHQQELSDDQVRNAIVRRAAG
jgi:predicted small metal-binding protein